MRNKIQRHKMSRAHKISQDLIEKGGQDVLGNLVRAVSETVSSVIDAVFRIYLVYLAKMNGPFSDHGPIELQGKNGVNMGTSLHSSTKIVEHILKKDED